MNIVDPFATKASGDIVDPFESKGVIDPFAKTEVDSAGKVFAKSAVESGVKSVFSLPGMLAGARYGAGIGAMMGGPASVSGIPEVIGAIGGGIIGGIAAGSVYEGIKEQISKAIPQDIAEASGFDRADLARGQKEHPYAAFAGGLAGSLVAFRPGKIDPIKVSPTKEIGELTQRAGMAGIAGGGEAVSEAMDKHQKMDPWKIAGAAAWGGFAAKPTQLTERMGGLFSKYSPVGKVDPKELIGEKTKMEYEIPEEVNGVPVKQGPTGRKRADGTYVAATFHRGTPQPESSVKAQRTLDVLSELSKSEPELLKLYKDDPDRLLARVADKHFDNLPDDIKQFLYNKPARDAETGETHRIGSPSEIGGGGDWNIHGTHIFDLRTLAENKGTSPEIRIDPVQATKDFETKPWTKPKVADVKPLPEDAFNSPDEWIQFLLAHEEMHTKVSRPEWVSKGEHENLINELALEHVRANPIADRPTAGFRGKFESMDDVRDSLWQVDNLPRLDKILGQQLRRSALEAGMNEDNMVNIRRSFEGENVKLTPEEQSFKDGYYKDLVGEVRKINEELQRRGQADRVGLSADHFPRQTLPPKATLTERIKKAIFGTDSVWDPNIQKVQAGQQERGIFKTNDGRIIEVNVNKETGKRRVIAWKLNDKFNPKLPESKTNSRYRPRLVGFLEEGTSVHSGKPVDVYKLKYSRGANGQPVASKEVFRIEPGEAKVDEIEAVSPYRYNKDSLGVLVDRIQEGRQQLRALDFIDDFKKSDLFKQNAYKLESNRPPPAGYKIPKSIDRMPALSGYAFEPRLADIIENFAVSHTPNALTKLSGVMVKNMMLNPLPHMSNEAFHWYNARGLSGWVTPSGIKRFMTTGGPALKEVITQGKEFQEMIKAGANMLSADVRVSALETQMFNQGLKEFVQTPEAKSLAKELGLTIPKLYDTISRQSSLAMWTVRDAMYMQLVSERMKYEGLSREAAIKDVERHMPNYRMPERVGEKVMGAQLSRALSETLQNPNVSVFSRYHYGMVKSLVETAKEMGGVYGKEGAKHGWDSAAAIAVAIAIMYPMLDALAVSMTGNKNASVRRAGPYHLGNSIYEVAHGAKEPTAVLNSVFTFNPALLGLAQLGFNHKLYNGQPVYHPTDDPGLIARDVGKYAVQQLPVASSSMRASAETGGGLKQWAAQQMDIKAPTDEQQARIDKVIQRNKTASEKRRLKKDLGLD